VKKQAACVVYTFNMSLIKSLLKRLSSVYRSLYFPPLIITAAILVATGATWRSSRQALNSDIQTAVSSHITATQRATFSGMKSYEEVLRGGVGFFRGSNEVTRDDWHNYLQSYEVLINYPSAQAIGFAKEVKAADIDSFTSYMQSQIPGFQIHPLTPGKDTYAPLTYAEAIAVKGPLNFGADIYGAADRRSAMLAARDTGSVIITKRVTLKPQSEPKSYDGFLMFAPYYELHTPVSTVDERKANLAGYIFASFRSDLFFKGVVDAADDNDRSFRVTAAGDTRPLYTADHFSDLNKRADAIHAARQMQVYGQTWNIDYVFSRAGIVSDVQLRRPTSVLMGGLFTAILIATVVLLLLRSRAQELNAQKEQAVELAKDELLSLASHQLRTPATGVKQYVGMVLQGFAGKIPKDQKALLEKAYASNDRQLSIINEILHLAKIDSGRIVLARHDTDINDLIQDIINELQPDIKAAGHTLSLYMPKKPLSLSVDAHTLRMAIENILSNAIKYTPDGGVITVRLRHDENFAYIRIKDTGVGIASGDFDKLFKQFSRLSNEMSVRVGGTGIGLYLARHLVELHNGRIDVMSTPGKGSTFTVTLPLKNVR
jgi:signal transduction histidine kinase